jgi:hypothetical protein
MKILAVVPLVLLFLGGSALAGEKSCWATGGSGAAASCTLSPSSTGTCTVEGVFVRFNAGCTVCTLSAVRCDLASYTTDLRVDLYTTGTNYTDEASPFLGAGFVGNAGRAVAVGCTNTGLDSVEVSMFAKCS